MTGSECRDRTNAAPHPQQTLTAPTQTKEPTP